VKKRRSAAAVEYNAWAKRRMERARLESRKTEQSDVPEPEREIPSEPTAAYPGTAGKVAALAERVAGGKGLWHPEDAVRGEND
jgi:hypothetical protein